MPLAAVFNVKPQNSGYKPGATASSGDATNVVSKNVSPAKGVVPTAKTGDFRAGAYVTASVLGTGQNTDTLTQGVEAV